MTDPKKKVGVPRTKEETKDSSSLLPESLDAEENDQREVQGGSAGRGYATVRAPPTVILDPTDYPGWAFQMRSLLEFADMWHLVDPAVQGAKLPHDEVRSIADTVNPVVITGSSKYRTRTCTSPAQHCVRSWLQRPE